MTKNVCWSISISILWKYNVLYIFTFHCIEFVMIYWFEYKISHFVENRKANQKIRNTHGFDEIRENYYTERLIYSATPVTFKEEWSDNTIWSYLSPHDHSWYAELLFNKMWICITLVNTVMSVDTTIFWNVASSVQRIQSNKFIQIREK